MSWTWIKEAETGFSGLKRKENIWNGSYKDYVIVFAEPSSKVICHEFLEHLISITFLINPRAENVKTSGCRIKLNK